MKTFALASLLCLSIIGLSGCGENPHVDIGGAASTGSSHAALNNGVGTAIKGSGDNGDGTNNGGDANNGGGHQLPANLGQILFGFNSANLNHQDILTLNQLVDYFRANPGLNITLVGNTSDEGSEAFNDRLSEKRAKAVETFLINAGIAPQRLSLLAHGEDYPLIDPSKLSNPKEVAAARAQNRRVEVVVTGSQTGTNAGSTNGGGSTSLNPDDSLGMVLFAFNSAVIRNSQVVVLSQIIDYSRAHPDAKLILVGNTSDEGSESLNDRLSAQRALAVHEYLVRAGVASSRLEMVARGEDHPLVDPSKLTNPNELEHARAMNRRVEVVLNCNCNCAK